MVVFWPHVRFPRRARCLGWLLRTCLVSFLRVGALTLPHLSPSKWMRSRVNYFSYPECKKQLVTPHKMVVRRHNWITFFWLVEYYIHFSYPKCGKVVMESDIICKLGEDEKWFIRKRNQCVTHLRSTYNTSVTNPRFGNIWLTHLLRNPWPKCDSSVTHL